MEDHFVICAYIELKRDTTGLHAAVPNNALPAVETFY